MSSIAVGPRAQLSPHSTDEAHSVIDEHYRCTSDDAWVLQRQQVQASAPELPHLIACASVDNATTAVTCWLHLSHNTPKIRQPLCWLARAISSSSDACSVAFMEATAFSAGVCSSVRNHGISFWPSPTCLSSCAARGVASEELPAAGSDMGDRWREIACCSSERGVQDGQVTSSAERDLN